MSDFFCCQCCETVFRHPLSITSHSHPCPVHYDEEEE